MEVLLARRHTTGAAPIGVAAVDVADDPVDVGVVRCQTGKLFVGIDADEGAQAASVAHDDGPNGTTGEDSDATAPTQARADDEEKVGGRATTRAASFRRLRC